MSDYPVNVSFDYAEGHRSRGWAITGILFPIRALIAIPHLIILYVLRLVMMVVAYVGYWATLFTGRLPEGFQNFLGGILRWQVRVAGWLFQTTDAYPPFTFEAGNYDVDFMNGDTEEHRNRGLAFLGVLLFLKSLILIPHLIVLIFVGIAAEIVGWIAYWAVLFTGRYPEGMFRLTTGFLRWDTRVEAWLLGLTDRYPPFGLGGDSPSPQPTQMRPEGPAMHEAAATGDHGQHEAAATGDHGQHDAQ